MNPIRVVSGTGTGPTATASYDAALADANVHNYNLVRVSSVVPPGATVERVGTAPDLGPVGERLTVVEARATAPGPCTPAASLGWVQSDAGGVFYEADGESVAEVERTVCEGLAAGRELRGWDFGDERVETATRSADAGCYATAVVLAVYGDSDPLL